MHTESSEKASIGAERRKYQRRKFRGKIEIEWGSATLTGTIQDIGPNSLFVELVPPLWVGARFLARILVKPALGLDCIVRRAEPGKGIAVTFEVVEETGKAQLEALLASLPHV
jgi:hypothetical protein